MSFFLVLLPLVSLATYPAKGQEQPLYKLDKLVRSSGGMPLCLVSPSENDRYAGYVVFEWNDDPYQREIFAEFKTPHPPRGRNQNPGPDKIRDCYTASQVPFFARTSDEILKKKAQWLSSQFVSVMPATTEVFGIALSAEVKEAFSQLRAGGNTLRSSDEQTGMQFLNKHPIKNFDKKIDRELTRLYGMGFAAQVYKAWLESDPENAHFKTQIIKALSQGNPAPVSEQYPGYVFAIVKGYGHNAPGNPFDSLQKTLKQMGLDARQITTDPYGRIDANAVEVASQLDLILKEGKKVVLIAGCVGATEGLGAIALLSDRLQNASATGYGQVAAFLSFSGMAKGSYLADWATNPLIWLFMRPKLFEQFNKAGATVDSPEKLESMKSLRTDQVKQFLAPAWAKLPKDMVVVSLVGTILNGLNKDGTGIRAIQDSLVRTQLKGKVGANDGYIEYPGTVIPPEIGRKSLVLVANSSHMFLDGDFEGLDLSTNDGLKAILNAVLGTLAKELR